MANAPFIHGVETVETLSGPLPVREVRTAIIAVIGTAPIGGPNSPVLLTNDVDDAKAFGPVTAGYTLPQALLALRAAGAGTIIAINVYDPVKHVAGVSAVVAADIVGAVDATGKRSGLKAFLDCRSLFGFDPKILIAPTFASQATVTAALSELATTLRGVALIDIPAGSSVQDMISGRGVAGTLKLNSASDRVFYYGPMLKAALADGTVAVEPYSQTMAGIIAATDRTSGYWCSPSNKVLPDRIIGTEIPITARLNDATCEANQLNAAGIVTVFAGYGTGFRTWGNRAASFPVSSDPRTFMSVRRTADMVEDSMEENALEFMDRPITRGLVDTMLETGNGFFRTLKSRGAITDGLFFYDATKNPAVNIAAGKLRLGYRFFVPTPLETLTYESFLDLNLASVSK